LASHYSRRFPFNSMHGSGADAECLSRFEDTRAGRQLRLNALNDIAAYRATAKPLSLAPRPREADFDPFDDPAPTAICSPVSPYSACPENLPWTDFRQPPWMGTRLGLRPQVHSRDGTV
jgi:hypothetical protein